MSKYLGQILMNLKFYYLYMLFNFFAQKFTQGRKIDKYKICKKKKIIVLKNIEWRKMLIIKF